MFDFTGLIDDAIVKLVKKKYHRQMHSNTLVPCLRLREGQTEMTRTEFDCHGIGSKWKETTGVIWDKKVRVNKAES